MVEKNWKTKELVHPGFAFLRPIGVVMSSSSFESPYRTLTFESSL